MRKEILVGLFAAGIGLGGLDLLLDSNLAEAKSKQTQIARPPKNHLQNKIEGNKTITYFLTNSWALYDNDKDDLRNFFRNHREASNFIVEGFCDERGSIDDNYKLGLNRANGVEEFFRQLGYTGKIDIASHGEMKPAASGRNKESYKRNRRVTVLAGENLIGRALEVSKADVYLLDASDSMESDGRWNAVRSYKFPKDSEKYAFNSCIGLRKIDSAYKVVPDCGTPFWDSTGSLIGSMGSGKKLTILSDGEDTGSTRYDLYSVVNLAKRNGIAVSTIAVMSNSDFKIQLRRLAEWTEGNFYEVQ